MSDLSKTPPIRKKNNPFGGGGRMRLGRPAEKPKDFKRTLIRLIKALDAQRPDLIKVLILALCSTLFGILSPRIMGDATTVIYKSVKLRMAGVQAPFDYLAIGHILMVLTGLYVFSALFGYLQQSTMAQVSQRTVSNFRHQLFSKMNRLPLRFFDSKTHGEVLSRITNDTDLVGSSLQQIMIQLFTSIVTLLGILVMMLTISPSLTLICLVTLPLGFVVTKQVALRSQQYFASQQKALGELNGHVEEMLSCHNLVKVFGREEQSMEEFDAINDRLWHAGWKAQFISGIIMPLIGFINNLGYVLICGTGGWLVMKGRIEIGALQAFIQYSRQFNHPVAQASAIVNVFQSIMASAERIFEIIDEDEEVPDVEKAAPVTDVSSVAFHNVSFAYSEDRPLIESLNLNVEKGQTIAIVGPTGAGKTTLVNLLMRFYDVDHGEITLDGIDIRQMSRSGLRSQLGMVLQDTWFFKGTIYENITYGRTDATEDEVYGAAKAANADHFIRTLPDGYQTILTEDGANLSQGQKQQLSIARTFLADPVILILDEATSNVDTRTEIHVQKAMAKLMKGRTSFIIAHRLSTIRGADHILVMDNGAIVEQGHHRVLLEANGRYAELYRNQFEPEQKEATA